MFRSLLLTVAGVFALVASTPDVKKFDLPPDGIHQTDVKLSELLKQHAAARGPLPTANGHETVEHWSFVSAGLAGAEVLQHAGSDYRSQITQGPFTQLFGQFNGVRWHRDENGFTSLSTGIDDESYAPLRTLNDLEDAKNDVSIAGEIDAPTPAYVVKVQRPQYRHPKWVFVDKKTWLIDKVEYGSGKRYYTSTFDDYRVTNGLNEPWHIHDTDGREKLDSDWKRSSLDRSVPLDMSQFVPAPNAPTVGVGGSSAQLPANFYRSGDMIVRLSVHGRGLDFLVDCASPASIIDRDVARELNLPTYDQVTDIDGTAFWYRTVVDDATLGPIRMRNFVMSVGHYSYNESLDTKVVGVLGYDFFAQNVVKVDYVNGTAELIPQSQFSAKNIAGSYVVPVTFDDRIPLIPAQIGNSQNARIAIDNAIPYTLAFSTLIDKDPSDFVDAPNTRHGSTLVPFADDSSFGVQAEAWVTHASHFRFGPSDYQKVGIVATNYPYEVNGRTLDAIIGLNSLAFYDVYYDFPDSQLVIKPNANFFKVFHAH